MDEGMLGWTEDGLRMAAEWEAAERNAAQHRSVGDWLAAHLDFIAEDFDGDADALEAVKAARHWVAAQLATSKALAEGDAVIMCDGDAIAMPLWMAARLAEGSPMDAKTLAAFTYIRRRIYGDDSASDGDDDTLPLPFADAVKVG